MPCSERNETSWTERQKSRVSAPGRVRHGEVSQVNAHLRRHANLGVIARSGGGGGTARGTAGLKVAQRVRHMVGISPEPARLLVKDNAED